MQFLSEIDILERIYGAERNGTHTFKCLGMGGFLSPNQVEIEAHV